jgi:hypothetical protein
MRHTSPDVDGERCAEYMHRAPHTA